jgi:catechol O-methyltransferase
MQGNPTKILDAMDYFAAQQDFLIHIGSDKARVITDLVAKQKPKVLVELGGYVGYSAIFFANEMRRHFPDDKSVRVWSLEFDENFAKIASELIEMAGVKDIVTVVTGSAENSLRKLKQEGQVDHIEFLFLDHVEDLYEQDLKVAMDELQLLPAGSIVVADNVVSHA